MSTSSERRRSTKPVATEARPRRRRDPLLSAVCHDLRAPLAAVTMGANFVLQTTADDEGSARQRRILEAMLRSCGQMERLVRNFADLSEIEGGAVALRVSSHDAGEMLELTAQAANEAASAKRITLVTEKPAERVVIVCDRDRVLRALGHLVDNAVRHAPGGSSIELTVDGDAKIASFTVTDHGEGISAELRPHIFDRAFLVRRSNKVSTGFGLAIAKGFARAHGGDLAMVTDSAETTFTLTLPCDGRPVSEVDDDGTDLFYVD